MKRFLVLTYGVVNYVVFLGVFLYLAAFLGNLWVSRSVDSTPVAPVGTALLIDTLLISLFGVQHSVMARPTFKQWWTKFIPQSIERSTYVLCTNAALILLFVFWQPIGGTVWDIRHPTGQTALWTLFALGWLTVLVTTFLINHFDLFGLRQVWLYFLGKPYTRIGFRTPGPYRFVRHPLYVGWIMAFWATPTMTVTHLVFAMGMSAYILIAIPFEERNLVTYHGKEYAEYRRNVPLLVPGLGKRGGKRRETIRPRLGTQSVTPPRG
ncbi:MAG: methanethiol S-methyltransferase [Pirellulaceae bacterium]